MALPSSGPLSFSQIGAALCTPQSAPYSLRSMSSAAGFSTPDSVSEFYGYSCVTYTNAGFVWSSNTASCSTTSKTKTFVYLNNTDYATFVANGNLFSAGMIFFSDASGTAWNYASYSKGYDQSSLVVWNIINTGITVNTFC